MGVEFFPCSRCEETYCDCGDYVTCSSDTGGCDRDWCSYECAEEDGLVESRCKSGCDISEEGYFEYDVNACIKIIDKDTYDGEEICCEDCPNYIPTSCNYCRKEDYEDDILLSKALGLLNLTREELINKINEVK